MKSGPKPTYHRDELMQHCLAVAADVGYNRMTRSQIANHAGCSDAKISQMFGTMPNLRRDVVRAAIAQGRLRVIAQALVARDPHVRKASDVLKQSAMEALL